MPVAGCECCCARLLLGGFHCRCHQLMAHPLLAAGVYARPCLWPKQFSSLDTRTCAVTGGLTLGISGTPTCLTLEDDMVLVGLSSGVGVTYRLRSINGNFSWPAAQLRPTRVLKGSMAGAVVCVALDRSADIAVLGCRGEAWVYEVCRGRVMFRVTLPSPSVVCRAACVVQGAYVVVCADDSRGGGEDGAGGSGGFGGGGGGGGGSAFAGLASPVAAAASGEPCAPFIAVYNSAGAVLRQVTVGAPVRCVVMERRVERWGGCLVVGDAKGVITFYHPFKLQVRCARGCGVSRRVCARHCG